MNDRQRGPVRLLDIPDPYRAMVAISTDIDGVPIDRFIEQHRFMNTREQTPLGRGLGLDIATSFWLTNAVDSASYVRRYAVRPQKQVSTPDSDIVLFNDLRGREKAPYFDYVKDCVARRWIDSIHSIGNVQAFARAEVLAAEPALAGALRGLVEALEDLTPRIRVWTNHAQIPANVGELPSFLGGNRSSPYYVADKLAAAGIRFIDLKENQSRVVTRSPLRPVLLEDGTAFWGFSRYTSVPGVSPGDSDAAGEEPARGHRLAWTPQYLHLQLGTAILDMLEANSAVCIAAQHLGVADLSPESSAVSALSELSRRQSEGRILVAGTAKLLNYVRIRDSLLWSVAREASRIVIDIRALDDEVLGRQAIVQEELSGIQFATTDLEATKIVVQGDELPAESLYRRRTAWPAGVIGFQWAPASSAALAAPSDPGRTAIREASTGPTIWSDDDEHTNEDFPNAYRIRALHRLERMREQPPSEGATEKHWRYAVDYAQRRFAQPYEHYAEIFGKLGLVQNAAVIDIGSGLGDWSYAMARFGCRVVGVDKDPVYVSIAQSLRKSVPEEAEAPRFLVASTTALPLPDACAEMAFCHGMLMFVEHEAALLEMRRVVGPGQRVYVAYTDFAHRVRGLLAAVQGGRYDDAAKIARILVNRFVYEAGIGNLGLGRVRIFDQERLVGLARLCGLSYESSPGVQDARGGVVGAPTTFDVVLKRGATPEETEEAHATPEGFLERFSTLLDLGAVSRAGTLLRLCETRMGSSEYALLAVALDLKAARRPRRLEADCVEKAVSAGPWSGLGEGKARLLAALATLYTAPALETAATLDSLAESLPDIADRSRFLAAALFLREREYERALGIFEALAESDDAIAARDADTRALAGATGAVAAALALADGPRIEKALARFLMAMAAPHLDADGSAYAVRDTLFEVIGRNKQGPS